VGAVVGRPVARVVGVEVGVGCTVCLVLGVALGRLLGRDTDVVAADDGREDALVNTDGAGVVAGGAATTLAD
jgi:hypothetical protein